MDHLITADIVADGPDHTGFFRLIQHSQHGAEPIFGDYRIVVQKQQIVPLSRFDSLVAALGETEIFFI